MGLINQAPTKKIITTLPPDPETYKNGEKR